MEETGIVESNSGGMATVLLRKNQACSECGMCDASGGAGMRIEVENGLGAKPGDEVVIAVVPSRLAIFALIYGLPSLFLAAGIILGSLLLRSELKAMLLGVAAFALAFIIIKMFRHIVPGFFKPVMKKAVAPGG